MMKKLDVNELWDSTSKDILGAIKSRSSPKHHTYFFQPTYSKIGGLELLSARDTGFLCVSDLTLFFLMLEPMCNFSSRQKITRITTAQIGHLRVRRICQIVL
ncbi:hypothetical protein AABB24_015409 [Solanum stoloniferum]|uniref:Uncharacterized protein n=1 Tax=Solanum stoloniferum TaxID=62892 RepID=A0ABD2TRY5_9SOLN